MERGKLFVVSTPVGNLDDITLRALATLREVDLIAAEDTRHTRKLLSAHGITKPLLSYWSETEKGRSAGIIQKIRNGMSVALVSDAGTPGISDPGALLIGEAIAGGIEVVPVPGPTALVIALSVSGLPAGEFTFLGYLPPRSPQRKKKLGDVCLEARTLVLYEAPHRVLETLRDMREVLGERRVSVSRELTKIHEETVRGTISEMIELWSRREVVGEYVIVIEGRPPGVRSLEEALEEVEQLMRRGKGRKEAVREVAEAYGVSKTELYNRSLGLGSA